MLIAILSDTHDQLDKLQKALEIIKQKTCQAILHCGDWCAPFIAKTLAEEKIPLYGVFGNVDGAQFEIIKWITQSGVDFQIDREILEFELDHKKIALNHYPEIAQRLAESGNYDLVCYGHNHIKKIDKVKNTYLVNPGTLSQKREGPPTFALYDTEKKSVELIEIND